MYLTNFTEMTYDGQRYPQLHDKDKREKCRAAQSAAKRAEQNYDRDEVLRNAEIIRALGYDAMLDSTYSDTLIRAYGDNLPDEWARTVSVVNKCRRAQNLAMSREDVGYSIPWETYMTEYGDVQCFRQLILFSMGQVVCSAGMYALSDALKLCEFDDNVGRCAAKIIAQATDPRELLPWAREHNVELPKTLSDIVYSKAITSRNFETAAEAATQGKIDPRTVEGANERLVELFQAVLGQFEPSTA